MFSAATKFATESLPAFFSEGLFGPPLRLLARSPPTPTSLCAWRRKSTRYSRLPLFFPQARLRSSRFSGQHTLLIRQIEETYALLAVISRLEVPKGLFSRPPSSFCSPPSVRTSVLSFTSYREPVRKIFNSLPHKSTLCFNPSSNFVVFVFVPRPEKAQTGYHVEYEACFAQRKHDYRGGCHFEHEASLSALGACGVRGL
ncbi:hypothetical protein C8R44DRAFT_877249 [Mycena epipterygia]|nr:hypothetical protein C8R44DRAFT_877249 [Mycena epipterygia]